MKIRSFILAFLLSILLIVLYEAILRTSQTSFSYLQNVLFMLYVVFGAFFYHLMLFGLYYFFTHGLVIIVKKMRWLYLSIIALAAIYIVTVFIYDWNHTPSSYRKIPDYFYQRGHYSVYAVVVVLILTPLKLVAIKRFQRARATENQINQY